MSSNPNSVSEQYQPFVPTTTFLIERANRLISLRAHPGFIDLLRISQELVDEATAVSIDYGGWDPQQIVVLKSRAQAAKEYHSRLIGKVMEAIRDGMEDASANASILPEKTPGEALEQGDYVRQKMLEKFDDMDARPAGSY